MTQVTSIVSTRTTRIDHDVSRAPTCASRSLLPEATLDTASTEDGLAALYKVLSQLTDAQARLGETRVNGDKAARNVALHRQQEAEARAAEAAREGGILDKIANNIGIAGAVGLVTFNYVVVAADVAAHASHAIKNIKIDLVDVGAVASARPEVLAADLLLRKTDLTPKEARDVLAQLGIRKDVPGLSDDDVKPVARKLVAANLLAASITASVLSCGTTSGLTVALVGIAMSQAGAYVSSEGTLDGVFGRGSSKWIGLGMEVYGTAASAMSGLATSGAAIAPAAKTGARVISGGLDVLHGSDRATTAIAKHAADEADIDATRARHAIARLERLVDFVIDQIRDVCETHKKTAKIVGEVMGALSETRLSLVANKG